MNKQDIYNYLKEKDIWHEITEHKAVYNMEELSEISLPYPTADAKNLFVTIRSILSEPVNSSF